MHLELRLSEEDQNKLSRDIANDISAKVDFALEAKLNGEISCSVKRAGEKLGLSESMIWDMIHTGELPSFKQGTRRLIEVDSLRAWVRDKVAETEAASPRLARAS